MIMKKTVNQELEHTKTDERTGNKSRKEDCGKILENVTSVYSVALLSQHNTFKYI
jgi:hypothetical protein